jgi:hypothetical protein
MAGSLKGFKYIADDGTTWALFADESNIESVNAGVSMAITPTEKYKVPKNLRPRAATFQNALGTIRRKVVVLTTARLGELDAASTIVDQVSGDTLQLKRTDGEVVSLVPLGDTGLLDGDAD